MQPKLPPDTRPEPDLFRSRLDNMLNRRHPLYRLAHKIDWGFFEKEFGPLYVEKVGRPGLPIRLLVGFHFLKHAFGESDESVVERFVENPYWHVRRIKIWHIRVPDFKVQVLGFGVGISWILTGSPGSAKVAV